MRVLVLGSGGFLGAHIADHLGTRPGVRVLHGGRFGSDLQADLTAVRAEDLAGALRALAPDAVVNCAGAVGGSGLRLAETNVRGPAVLCEAVRLGAPGARLIHLGSAGEYGAVPVGRPIGEAAPTCPVGAYGATKLAGSLVVAGAGDLDAVVLRVFNPLGRGVPGSSLPGRLTGELRAAVATSDAGPGVTVTVGDLSAHRDFVDARDVAQAVRLAVTAPGPLPRVLNIGSGTATPVRAVADGLVALSGFTGRIEEIGGAGSERSSAVPWQQADIGAAGSALGWRPTIAFADTLADLWAAA